MKTYYQSIYDKNYYVKIVKGVGKTCYFTNIKLIEHYRNQKKMDNRFFKKINKHAFYRIIGSVFNFSLPIQLTFYHYIKINDMNELQQLEQIFSKLQTYGLLDENEENIMPELFLKIETKFKKQSEFIEFVSRFNQVTGLKYIPDIESRKLFYKGIGTYTVQQRINAVENALKDNWIIENQYYLTLKNFCKHETIAKYYNRNNFSNNSTSKTTNSIQNKNFKNFNPTTMETQNV